MELTRHTSRREFLRNAILLAGAGATAPLWAAMKYDRNAVLRYFREQASEMDARVKAGIEANRKGDATLVFTDAQGRPCENVHVKVRQTRHDFKYGANLFGLAETKNGAEHAAAGRAQVDRRRDAASEGHDPHEASFRRRQCRGRGDTSRRCERRLRVEGPPPAAQDRPSVRRKVAPKVIQKRAEKGTGLR